MKKLALLTSLFLLLASSSPTQSCDGTRYLQEVFPGFTKTVDVVYGQNYDLNGSFIDLKMDVYEPDGDTETERPLLILFHGGHFLAPPVGGDKSGEDVAPIAEAFAKMGYVAVSADYRVGMEGFPIPGPDSVTAMESVWRAVGDAKACVRYFRKDAATANQYKIDTSKIFFGGSSAGAVTAVHYVFVDEIAEIPSGIDTTAPGMGGGLAGTSGNPGYSSKVHAFISISGALGDTAWCRADDEPLLSFHGDLDDLVPFGSDLISLLGIYPLLNVDGSESIHYKLNQLGADHCFKHYWGAPHTPQMSVTSQFYTQYLDSTVSYMKSFLYNKVCGGPVQCEYIMTDQQADVLADAWKIYPNPSNGWFRIDGIPHSGPVKIRIFDMFGRLVWEASGLSRDALELGTEGMHPGIYLVKVEAAERKAALRLVVN